LPSWACTCGTLKTTAWNAATGSSFAREIRDASLSTPEADEIWSMASRIVGVLCLAAPTLG